MHRTLKTNLWILVRWPLLAIIFGSSIYGCAAIQRMVCTPDQAFSQGMDDGRSGQAMDPDYASICDTGKAKLNKTYRRAYMKGMKHPDPRPDKVIIIQRSGERRHHHRD